MRRDQRGQGMTEYIIIVALVAIAAIGVVGIFGDNIRAMLGASVNALAGSSTASTQAQAAGDTSGHRNTVNFAQGGGSDNMMNNSQR